MKERLVLIVLFAFAFSVSAVSAYSLDLSDDGANAVVSISNAVNLYSYEVILNYTGNIEEDGIDYSNFLGDAGVDATYSYNFQEGNYIYVYGSRLAAGDPGINGSGRLFTLPHVAGNLTLWADTIISSNDITNIEDGNYTAYFEEARPRCGDNICNNGEICSSCPADCGACPAPTIVSGGGGGTVTKYYSLKIVTPGEISISDKNYIEVPLKISNTGITDLTGITLKAEVTFNGAKTQDLQVALAKNTIDVVPAGKSEDFDLVVSVNTKNFGKYAITIYADVQSPKISDYGVIYIDLQKVEASEAEQNLVFAQKLIDKNPQCLELGELVKEAKKLYDDGDYRGSVVKLQEAVDTCTGIISRGESSQVSEKNQLGLILIAAALCFSILVLGLIIYIYKRSKI